MSNIKVPKFVFALHHGRTEFEFFNGVKSFYWKKIIDEFDELDLNEVLHDQPNFHSLNKGGNGITVDTFEKRLNELVEINNIEKMTNRIFGLEIQALKEKLQDEEKEKYLRSICISFIVFIDFNERNKKNPKAEAEILKKSRETFETQLRKLEREYALPENTFFIYKVEIIHSDRTIESSIPGFYEFKNKNNQIFEHLSKPESMREWIKLKYSKIIVASLTTEQIKNDFVKNDKTNIFDFFNFMDSIKNDLILWLCSEDKKSEDKK